MGWYYSKGEQQFGPILLEQLVAGAQSGTIVPTDLIWTDGMPCWLPADSVPDLFSKESPHPLLKPMIEPAADPGADPVTRMILPVGRSGWAIASGYLGLCSVLIFPAPFALATGIVAVREMRRNPKLHGMGRAIFGIVMGGIGTVLVLIFLMATLVHWLSLRR